MCHGTQVSIVLCLYILCPVDVDDVVVVHYAGWQKPWKVRWQDYVSHYYWDVRVLEKMKRSEYFVKFLGKFLSFICFNDIIRYVCAPYYWIKCRFESKQR